MRVFTLNDQYPSAKKRLGLIVAFSTMLIGLTLSSFTRAGTINIDYSQTSLSGLSSGAYMATQFHRAHGETIMGAAMISAGPYYCAQGSLGDALQKCVNKAPEAYEASLFDFYSSVNNDTNVATKAAIENDKLWLLHGNLDTRIVRKVNDALHQQYKKWVKPSNLKYIDTKDFAHVFPTLNFDGECTESSSPFIGNCDFDAAGEFLAFIYGELKAREEVSLSKGQLIEIEQHELINIDGTGLNDKGFVFLPKSCADGATCKLHISFHGCNQSVDHVGNAYAKHAGINEWAVSNNMIVLYPQIRKSSMFPMNPQACWDWWGYTDKNYANKQGSQIKAIFDLMHALPHGLK